MGKIANFKSSDRHLYIGFIWFQSCKLRYNVRIVVNLDTALGLRGLACIAVTPGARITQSFVQYHFIACVPACYWWFYWCGISLSTFVKQIYHSLKILVWTRLESKVCFAQEVSVTHPLHVPQMTFLLSWSLVALPLYRSSSVTLNKNRKHNIHNITTQSASLKFSLLRTLSAHLFPI